MGCRDFGGIIVSFASLQRQMRSPRGFLTLAMLVAAVCWSLGLLLTPDRRRFLMSPEWHCQPFYLAAHIVALNLFVMVYRLNFSAGIAHLAIDPAEPAAELKQVFTPSTWMAAAIVASPFAILDYLYLYSDRYQTMSADGVRAIDLLMWGIWCAEWYLNALIWVVLVGFLIKSCRVIHRFPFKSPIEVVLHERQYRPFLRMSAQGASIVLGFSFATVLYIWYTGGELTDYIGLMVTGGLLIVGFLTPWFMLKSKIDRAVRLEMVELRRQLAVDMQRGRLEEAEGDTRIRSLEHRLDEVLGMLRITYLEQRHDKIGETEAKAVLFRLMAPMLTIAWQFRQHSLELWRNLGGVLGDLAGYLSRLPGGG